MAEVGKTSLEMRRSRSERLDGMSTWISEPIRIMKELDLGRKNLSRYSLCYIKLCYVNYTTLYYMNKRKIAKCYPFKTLLNNEKELFCSHCEILIRLRDFAASRRNNILLLV